MHLSEQSEIPDDNDVDIYGMDARTRKRLGVKKQKKIRKKSKPKRPLRMAMPAGLRFEAKSKLRKRTYRARKLDPIKKFFLDYYRAVPEFPRSIAGRIKKSGTIGYIAQGSWPSSGRQVFDWELEVWKDKRDLIIKVNLWGRDGHNIGEAFRVTMGQHKKFLIKHYNLYIDEMIAEMKARNKRLK